MELKAKELEMQAKLLQMQGEMAKASAQELEDPVDRQRATDAANAQIEAGKQMSDLADQQREAAELQAQMEEKLLDNRERQLELAEEADAVALDAQKRQLEAQHAYDQTMNDAQGQINYEPEVNIPTQAIDEAEAEYRDRLQQAKDNITGDSGGELLKSASKKAAANIKASADTLDAEANEFADAAQKTAEGTSNKLLSVAKKFNEQMSSLVAVQMPEVTVPVNVEPVNLEVETQQKGVEKRLDEVMKVVSDNASIRKQLDSLTKITQFSKQAAEKKSSFSSNVDIKVNVNVDQAGNETSTIDERLENVECGQ